MATWRAIMGRLINLDDCELVASKRSFLFGRGSLYYHEKEGFILEEKSLFMTDYFLLIPQQAFVWCMMEDVKISDRLANIFIKLHAIPESEEDEDEAN